MRTDEPHCLITGASSGIGEGLARYLSDFGWKLTLAARRAEKLNALAESLSCGGLPKSLRAGSFFSRDRTVGGRSRDAQAAGALVASAIVTSDGFCEAVDARSGVPPWLTHNLCLSVQTPRPTSSIQSAMFEIVEVYTL